MTKSTLKHEFFKYVSLNIIGMIGLSCYILADTYFIAQGISTNALTSLNIALPIYSFIHGTGLMIGLGGATRFSISNSKSIYTQSLYCTTFMSVVFLIFGIFYAEQLAKILGADSETLLNTSIYIRTILCFSPMFLLNNVLICFVRNDGNPRLAMTAMLTGSFSNIILDYILIFPCNMGIFGAALATGIAPTISVLILSTHIIKKKNTFHIKIISPNIKKILDITSLGISALITEFSSGIVIIVFNMVILDIAGNLGVAAYGIIANIALVIVAIFTGISQGAQPIISRCIGEKKHKDARKILSYALVSSAVIAIIVYLTTVIFAENIVSAFNKDANEELAKIAVNGLYIYFTAFVFVGVNILITSYFSSTSQTKSAFILSLLRGFIIIIPTALILSYMFGINGVWLTMPVAELAVFFIAIFLLKSSTRNNFSK